MSQWDIFSEPGHSDVQLTDEQRVVLGAFLMWGSLQDWALVRAYGDWHKINKWPKLSEKRLVELRKELAGLDLLMESDGSHLPPRLQGVPLWHLTQEGRNALG